MKDDNSNRGFSGLSNLASDISHINDGSDRVPSSSSQKPPKLVPKSNSSNVAELKVQPIEPVEQSNSSKHTGLKWLLGILGVMLVIGFINNQDQNSTVNSNIHSRPTPRDNSSQRSSTPFNFSNIGQNEGLQFEKPPVGVNNILSLLQIRWCVREGIRIDIMRDRIDSNDGIDQFNKIVDDYNSRCGNFRYSPGILEQARREVEAIRNQIVIDAINDAFKLEGSIDRLNSYKIDKNSTQKRPDTKITREVQRLLKELGFDPGPVDGIYGRRTADAIKEFQDDNGLSQDGLIDEDLVFTLRNVLEQQEQSSETQNHDTSPKPTISTAYGIPTNAHVDYTGRN